MLDWLDLISVNKDLNKKQRASIKCEQPIAQHSRGEPALPWQQQDYLWYAIKCIKAGDNEVHIKQRRWREGDNKRLHQKAQPKGEYSSY